MKKSISILLSLVLLVTLSSCGEKAESESAAPVSEVQTVSTAAPAADAEDGVTKATPTADAEGNSISGTVASVSGDTVTLEDGTVFTLTEETVYTMAMPEGMDFDGAQAPEKPDGEMPEMPEGGFNGGSERPEMPEGGFNGGDIPEMPEGGFNGGGERPEMPEGGFNGGGERPEMPEGGFNGGDMPGMPSDMGSMELSAEMLSVGSTVTVILNADGTASEVQLSMGGGFGGGMTGGFGADEDIEYSAANTYTKTVKLSGESFSSTGKDENAILVTDGELTLKKSEIDRSSADSTGGDNSSFYGVGAALLTTGGSVNLSSSTITTDAAGGAGVFAYGDGVAYVSDCDISTVQNCSGGIHVAGGGTLYAWDLNVETQGESSAAIRSDRGSGTMVVDGGSYTSKGIGSPAIYSTADISVNNATLTATGSEAICIEGKNSIRLFDCELSGNMSDDSRNDCTWNVILYQSMSGDSEIGNSLFEMVGGSMTANNGGVFYTTNTASTFVLSGVDIKTAEDCEFLLRCTGNSNQRGWGKTGANGADCCFYGISQTLSGDVIWDSISTLRFSLSEGSRFTGAILCEDDETGDGSASLSVDGDSCWIVTADSRLSSLACAGRLVDGNGKSVSVIGTDGTVYVEGESDITVTVDSYSDSAETVDVTVSSFSDYAVAQKA